MILTEITINGTVNRVSFDGHALTYNWKPRIINLDAPTLALPSDYGGFGQMSFGKISFNPELFSNDWPPPVVCPISIYYTDTTEAARELVFSGTAHLSEFDREKIEYNLFGPSYSEQFYIMGVPPLVVGRTYEIVDYKAGDDFLNVGASSNSTGEIFTATGTTPTTWTNFSQLAPHYDTTLNETVEDILSVITEIATLDTTYARSPSPNVLYTLTSTQLAINLLSNLVQFYSHLLYIEGTTAYLIDMLGDNGSRTLTEFKFFAFPKYQYKTPVASASAAGFSRFSSYAHGSNISPTPFHSTQANVEDALDDIISLENSPRAVFDFPMIAGNFPKLGEKIAFPDTGTRNNLSSWIRCRKLTFDFLNDAIKVEGEGNIST
jgi:hypothetical protein